MQKQRKGGDEDGAFGCESSLCCASGVDLMQGRDGKRSGKRKADSMSDENESETDSVKVIFIFSPFFLSHIDDDDDILVIPTILCPSENSKFSQSDDG